MNRDTSLPQVTAIKLLTSKTENYYQKSYNYDILKSSE